MPEYMWVKADLYMRQAQAELSDLITLPLPIGRLSLQKHVAWCPDNQILEG